MDEETPLYFLRATSQEYTVSEVIEEIGWGKYQFFLLSVTALVWMADAVEVMILSFLPSSAVCSFNISSAESALLTTLIFVGMAVGSFFFGMVSDNFGRKKAFLLGAFITTASGVATSFALNFAVLAVCRIFVGFGVASAHVSVTIFIEYSPKGPRGKCVLFLAVAYTIGLLISVGIAWLTLTYFPLETGWRYYVGFASIPMGLAFLISPLVPESCRWLLLHNRKQDALKAIQTVAHFNQYHLNFVNLIAPQEEKEEQSTLVVFSPYWRRTTLLLWVMWFVLTFQYYGAILLIVETSKKSGDSVCPFEIPQSINSSLTINTTTVTCSPISQGTYIDLLITTCGEIPGVLLALLLVDKLGRKRTMFIGFLVSSICSLSLFICFPTLVATALMFIFRGANSACFQTIWVYTPEIYPTSMRAKATGTSVTISRFGAMVAPYVFVYFINLSSTGHIMALAITGASGLIAALCTFFLPFETTNAEIKDTTYQKAE